MVGNGKVIEVLNKLLAEELTAINQYMVHAEIAEAWGYSKLEKISKKQAIDEMLHAEHIISRIIFLESRPIVSKLNVINIGEDIPGQISNDIKTEKEAIQSYNDAIKIAAEAKDFATVKFLQKILEEEEAHLDKLEELKDQIKQMGVSTFLSTCI